jgi:hypothetical protein
MPQRVVSVPLYAVLVLAFAAFLGPPVSMVASIMVANRNSEQLIERYRADRAAQTEANRVLYCTLFETQLDAFKDATSPAGKASYAAWLDLYRLARCEPPR